MLVGRKRPCPDTNPQTPEIYKVASSKKELEDLSNPLVDKFNKFQKQAQKEISKIESKPNQKDLEARLVSEIF